MSNSRVIVIPCIILKEEYRALFHVETAPVGCVIMMKLKIRLEIIQIIVSIGTVGVQGMTYSSYCSLEMANKVTNIDNAHKTRAQQIQGRAFVPSSPEHHRRGDEMGRCVHYELLQDASDSSYFCDTP